MAWFLWGWLARAILEPYLRHYPASALEHPGLGR